jgi:hypothetical protein
VKVLETDEIEANDAGKSDGAGGASAISAPSASNAVAAAIAARRWAFVVAPSQAKAEKRACR